MRKIITVSLPLCAAASALVIKLNLAYILTLLPECRFHTLTGLYCPGCGGTRAVIAFFEGRFFEAFKCNAGLCILGVLSLFWYFEYAFNKKILPQKAIFWAVLGIALAIYYIARNF